MQKIIIPQLTTQIAVKLAEKTKLNISDAAINKLGKALKKHSFLRLKRQGVYVYALYEKTFDEVEAENGLVSDDSIAKENLTQSQFRFQN